MSARPKARQAATPLPPQWRRLLWIYGGHSPGSRTLLRIGVLIVMVAFQGSAQTIGGYALRIHIVDSLTRSPIQGVTVEVDGFAVRRNTDSIGQAVFASLPSTTVLNLRRFGYRTRTDTVRLEGSGTSEMTMALWAIPSPLTEVRIGDRMVQVPTRFEAAYKRAASGRGIYFTHEDIEQINAKDFQSLLNRVPTVNANDRGVTFRQCQGGLGSHPSDRSKVQVWVDGYRISGRAPGDDLMEALATVHPSAVQIMEVYSSVTKIPAEFQDDACAVIVIWTKSH